MKYISILLIFIIWTVATIILAITVIGLFVLAEDAWFEIPNKILKEFNNEKTSN